VNPVILPKTIIQPILLSCLKPSSSQSCYPAKNHHPANPVILSKTIIQSILLSCPKPSSSQSCYPV
ncbi:MAG: hypothetical protein J7M01_02560, partial [Candidatus Marinimicrobia bacterium]|nr:hypothetical protein [Candidatus Neomarinimicrobiota bacterium]